MTRSILYSNYVDVSSSGIGNISCFFLPLPPISSFARRSSRKPTAFSLEQCVITESSSTFSSFFTRSPNSQIFEAAHTRNTRPPLFFPNSDIMRQSPIFAKRDFDPRQKFFAVVRRRDLTIRPSKRDFDLRQNTLSAHSNFLCI